MSYTDLNTPARVLLGPGPSMVHPRVLRALGHPLVGHLDPAFLIVMDEVQHLLRYVFQTTNRLTVPISGAGSAAMEAALCNFLEPGDPILIGVNGYFGERMCEVAERCAADVIRLERPWGEVFAPEDIEKALRSRPAKVVALIHAETSTGTLQPMDGIADVVHAQGGLLVLDCVTSLGGLPVTVDAWGVDVAYSGTQKCLSCPPGLAPLTVSPRALEVLHNRRTPVKSWYLDLRLLDSYWGNERTYHHTAPISMNFALREALRLIDEEGLDARFERHRANANLLWEGLTDLGLKPMVPAAYRLPTLTTLGVGDLVDEHGIRKRLLDNFNIEIAGGLDAFRGRAWRIGLMGYSARPENVALLLSALERVLMRRGSVMV